MKEYSGPCVGGPMAGTTLSYYKPGYRVAQREEEGVINLDTGITRVTSYTFLSLYGVKLWLDDHVPLSEAMRLLLEAYVEKNT